MTLQYFTVTYEATAAVPDLGDLTPGRLPVSGTVTFTTSVPVLLDDDPSPQDVFVQPQSYGLLNGVLVDGDGNPEVTLISPWSADLSLQGWNWIATFNLKGGLKREPITFTGEPGETVNLTHVAPIGHLSGIPVLRGPKGDPGTPGSPGTAGASAYAVAVANGYSGTQAQWLEYLRQGPKGDPGTPGLSPYQLAVENGYIGSVQQWLESLRGPAGPPGQPSGAWTVIHGDNANYPRPNTPGPVVWKGTVDPVNANDSQDVWDRVVEDLGGNGTGAGGTAASTLYAPGSTGLAADTVQEAIDELAAEKADITALAPVAYGADKNKYSALDGKPATDPAAGTAGLRTLGAGSQQAAPGNHAHDARYPMIVNQSGGAYPARPSGAAIVIWRGALDPGVLAANGDEWRQV